MKLDEEKMRKNMDKSLEILVLTLRMRAHKSKFVKKKKLKKNKIRIAQGTFCYGPYKQGHLDIHIRFVL